MDDRGDRIEESERFLARGGADALGEAGRGEGAGGDDRKAFGGELVHPLADDGDVGMRLERGGDAGREAVAVDGQRRAGGNLVHVALGEDQRAEIAHFLMEQADGVALGIVRAERVGADELGEAVGVVGGGHMARAAHFRELYLVPGLSELPCGFGAGEAAADDVDVVSHGGRIARCGPHDKACRLAMLGAWRPVPPACSSSPP